MPIDFVPSVPFVYYENRDGEGRSCFASRNNSEQDWFEGFKCLMKLRFARSFISLDCVSFSFHDRTGIDAESEDRGESRRKLFRQKGDSFEG